MRCRFSFLIHPYQRPKWFSPALKHQSNCLRSLKKRLRGNTSPVTVDHIQAAADSFQSNLSVAKTEYESRLIENFAVSNDSKLFQYLRSLTSSDSIPQRVRPYQLDYVSRNRRVFIFNNHKKRGGASGWGQHACCQMAT